MEGIFPGNGILLFESVQQGTVEWIHCSLSSGVNVNISYLMLSKARVVLLPEHLTDKQTTTLLHINNQEYQQY